MMNYPAAWRDAVSEVATASDNYWRIGTLINELKNGKSFDSAAKIAREAQFDYSAMTDFEKKVMRFAFLFYSYMRRSTDLFCDTMMTNPQRVLGQLRLIRGLNEVFLEEEPEIVKPDYYDWRLMAGFRESAIEQAKVKGIGTLAPPIPISDQLNMMVAMADL